MFEARRGFPAPLLEARRTLISLLTALGVERTAGRKPITVEADPSDTYCSTQADLILRLEAQARFELPRAVLRAKKKDTN